MEENNRQRARKILFLSRYYHNTMEWGEIDFSRKRLRSSNWKTACWIWISHFERQLHASNGLSCSGIKSDKTTIEETVDNLSRWKMKNITLVWDRGFVSKSNIDYARKENFHVLSGGPHTSKEVDDWITKYTDSEIEKRENILEMSRGNGVYC